MQKPKKHSKAQTPEILSSRLQRDVTQLRNKLYARGLSERSVKRVLFRKFGKVIEKELMTNPVTARQVKRYYLKDELKKYRPWVRPFIRLYRLFNSSIKQP